MVITQIIHEWGGKVEKMSNWVSSDALFDYLCRYLLMFFCRLKIPFIFRRHIVKCLEVIGTVVERNFKNLRTLRRWMFYFELVNEGNIGFSCWKLVKINNLLKLCCKVFHFFPSTNIRLSLNKSLMLIFSHPQWDSCENGSNFSAFQKIKYPNDSSVCQYLETIFWIFKWRWLIILGVVSKNFLDNVLFLVDTFIFLSFI